MKRDESRSGGSQWLALRLQALRAFSFPVSVLPVVVAAAAVLPYGQWRWGVLVASVFGAMLLHALGNLLNDYFDFRSGVDRKVEGDEGRPGRLLVRGELSPKDVLVEVGICGLLLVPPAVYLLATCGPGLVWFGVCAVAGLYVYTGPPFAFKYRAVGEPLIFVVFGPLLMLGAAYAQTGRLEWQALVVSVPVGLATTSILVGNNIRDSAEDKDARIVTLTRLAGDRIARIVYLTVVTMCVASVGVLGAVGLGPRMFIAAPLLLVLVRRPLHSVWRGERIPNIDVQTARFETVFLLALIVALVHNGGLVPSQ